MKETKIFAVIEEKKGFTIRYDRQNQKWYVIVNNLLVMMRTLKAAGKKVGLIEVSIWKMY
jgi:hypothetical protein